MSSLDRYSTLKHSKVKEQREKQMWGNSYTQEDEEEAGSPCLLTLHQWLPGAVCPSWPPHSSGHEWAMAQSLVAGAKRKMEKPWMFGTRCCSQGNLWVPGYEQRWIFKQQIAGYYSPKPWCWVKPSCLHVTSGMGVQKIQDCTSLLM